MTSMQPERFTVAMTPLPTAARVMRQRRTLRMRWISAGISLLIVVGIAFLLDRDWDTWSYVWLFGIWGVTTVVWIVVSLVGLHRAKSDLASISQGDALHVDREGIEFCHPAPVRAGWSEVTALRIRGSNFGAGPDLVLETGAGVAAKVPMSFLDAVPSAIDSAVVARSMGRVRLDVSDMDRML